MSWVSWLTDIDDGTKGNNVDIDVKSLFNYTSTGVQKCGNLRLKVSRGTDVFIDHYTFGSCYLQPSFRTKAGQNCATITGDCLGDVLKVGDTLTVDIGDSKKRFVVNIVLKAD